MHVGRIYPFAEAFWLVENLFWPAFCPKYLWVHTDGANGDFWDYLVRPIRTGIFVPSLVLPGDVSWTKLVARPPDPSFALTCLMHKVSDVPKVYSFSVRMETLVLPGPHVVANIVSGEFGPTISFPSTVFSLDSGPDLPTFNGQIPNLVAEPARWAVI